MGVVGNGWAWTVLPPRTPATTTLPAAHPTYTAALRLHHAACLPRVPAALFRNLLVNDVSVCDIQA